MTNPGLLRIAFGRYLQSLDPDLDVNEGLLQNLDEWVTREGSILKPRFPAPLGMRANTRFRVLSCIFGALAQANGGRVPAGSPVYVLYYFRAWDEARRRPILCIEGLGVGLGARPFADGVDVIYYIAQENYPVEYVERDFPLRVERYAVRPDSGGPGYHRGGAGVVRDVRVLCERAELATRMENTLVAPYGVAGGRAGRTGRVILNPGTPGERELPALGDGIVLERGDLLRFETCGGGGWGDPAHARPRARAPGRGPRLRHSARRARGLRRGARRRHPRRSTRPPPTRSAAGARATSPSSTAAPASTQAEARWRAARSAVGVMNGAGGGGSVLWDLDARGVATVTLNRPEVNNAYNGDLIQGLHEALDALGASPSLRVLVLRGNGKHFQAGVDLRWLSEVAKRCLPRRTSASRAPPPRRCGGSTGSPVPTVALVQGGCFGGGTGFAAACDVVVAGEDAIFSISETRWGLMAGIILPQLCQAIGLRQVRRYALTGERFDAQEARRIGLVHVVCASEALAEEGARIVDAVLMNAPGATAATKLRALQVAEAFVDDGAFRDLVREHAATRQGDEAAEGVASFREKRAARWYPGRA